MAPSQSCWRLNEIASTIAAILVSDEATASAVALARCSRSLEEPVLCEVWRRLSSLTPLVKCFPPEVWDIKDGVLVFKRVPFSIEWTRFQQRYASKVRHLKVSFPATEISSAAIQLLQLHFHGGSLLPNLLCLHWNSDDANLPFISSFLSRSLTSIAIEVPATASIVLSQILMRLSTMAPDLSNIEVECPNLTNTPSIKEASSQLLMQCNSDRLVRYYVDSPLSSSALSRVLQLPLLEAIWLVSPFDFLDPLPDVVFPSLKLLVVEFTGDVSWLKLLPKCPILSVIQINFPAPEVARLTEAFHSTMGCELEFHDRLRELLFWSHDEFEITPRTIACIIPFKNLTLLELYSAKNIRCQTLHLTDLDISLLTNAMPGLITLTIGEEPCSAPSKITFSSLYTISHRCTRLKNLRIHFDPASFVTKVNADYTFGNGDFETPSSDLCSVTRIDVGSIALPRRCNVVYIMALGLMDVFPHLEEVDYHDVAWKDVCALIKFQRHIRTAFVRG